MGVGYQILIAALTLFLAAVAGGEQFTVHCAKQIPARHLDLAFRPKHVSGPARDPEHHSLAQDSGPNSNCARTARNCLLCGFAGMRG